MSENNIEKWPTLKEVQDYLGVGRETMLQWIDKRNMFGNIDWNDADNVRRQILEIPAMVSKDERYQNALKNSDRQNACMESERALQQVIFSIMADKMDLFKQFQDNPSFKKWLSDMVFHLTYNPDGKPYQMPPQDK